MIRVWSRATRAVPLTLTAVVLALGGAAGAETVLRVPFLPMGLPATWLVALASANLFVIAVRPAWGSISLTLRRNPTIHALQLGFAVAISAGAYAPVALVNPLEPSTTAWMILMAVAAVSAAVSPSIAWLPVTLVGIGIEALNNLTMDAWYRTLTIHEASVRTIAVVAFSIGVVAIVARARRAGWYAL